MKRSTIQRLFAMCSQEVFIIRVVGQRDGLSDVIRNLVGLPSASKVNGRKVVTSCDLAGHEEVVLPILSRALSDKVAKLSLRFDRDLCSFVESEAIDIQHRYCNARKVFDLFSDRRYPFSETVLNGGELGQLALPVGEHTECFGITILREVDR